MKKALNAIAQWLVYMAYQPIAVAAVILGTSAIIVALIVEFSPKYQHITVRHSDGTSSEKVFDQRTGSEYSYYNKKFFEINPVKERVIRHEYENR